METFSLPISALQHWIFCRRQAALIHLEQAWAENRLTAEGRVLHRRVHEDPSESRGGIRIARGLPLRSLRLGLYGVADVVEFHPPEGKVVGDWKAAIRQAVMAAVDGEVHGNGPRSGPCSWPGVQPLEPCKSAFHSKGVEQPRGMSSTPSEWEISGSSDPGVAPLARNGHRVAVQASAAFAGWRILPVETKRGKGKRLNCDRVQVCAQALCLEEMLGVTIESGAIFYGETRRRETIPLTADLRQETEESAKGLAQVLASGQTPPPEFGPKCRSCSLKDQCMPQASLAASRWLTQAVRRAVSPEEEP